MKLSRRWLFCGGFEFSRTQQDSSVWLSSLNQTNDAGPRVFWFNQYLIYRWQLGWCNCTWSPRQVVQFGAMFWTHNWPIALSSVLKFSLLRKVNTRCSWEKSGKSNSILHFWKACHQSDWAHIPLNRFINQTDRTSLVVNELYTLNEVYTLCQLHCFIFFKNWLKLTHMNLNDGK